MIQIGFIVIWTRDNPVQSREAIDLFYINDQTQEYIRKHQGAVTIALEFEPAMGGCCLPTTLRGSYVAKVYSGPPGVGKKTFLSTQVDDIQVFYPENLTVKEGFSQIEIRLTKRSLIKWLEVIGVQGKVMA